ncbi:LytTR family transcriptional regulator DNA-binding domain-containing protein [Paenibacillus sp. P46E]|uniref:LytTR family transcriptional regulator DNA-binding domain-containing protein n=1 Tax=Paenibacillus sp. P46E TaxID=1349436 RepID=UPI00093C13F5|nr:LytTR family transcriptional regulator DNA-binding domain-containing protein [Paenibacillus sp. P46E]OKP96830.1 hypothetical protein A3849_19080 [Paenibacillus sp. P46E]
MISLSRKIVGVRVAGNGPINDFFYEVDIMNIEMWRPKSNYNVPIFYTTKGNFTVLTTLESCVDAFPAFYSLDGSNLVNVKNINRIDTGNFGGVAYFRDSNIHTGVNIKNVSTWDRIVDVSDAANIDDRLIFVNKISSTGKTERGELIFAKDAFYFDTWEPKRNYKVPRIYTGHGEYSVGLTLQSCKDAFPHLYPAHNGSLVNIDLIEAIDKDLYGYTIRYKNSDYSSVIARDKAKYLKEFLGLQ